MGDREPPHPPESGGTARWWALLVVIVLVSGVAVWMISPRFAIEMPSLVDDWAAISRSPDQLSEIARLTNPEVQRFRPGWILWNYLQWHTLDAPQGVVGPNLWNVMRTLALVAGLCLLTALALPTPRSKWEAVMHTGLAGIPALLVVTAPKFAVDLARFGPQEPLLVGGMALGGAMLVLAAHSLLDVTRPLPRWRTPALGVVGAALWVVGVYQKETSLAALPLVAAALFVGRRRLAGWGRLSFWRRGAVGVMSAIVVLPFVHVVIESVRIVSRGDLVYEAEVDGGLGAARGLGELYDWAHEALPPNWRLCAIGAVLLTALAVVVRRSLDWLALGALVSGGLALALAGQSGVVSTRYYIPAFALFMFALSLSLARFPLAVQLLGLVGILVAFLPSEGNRADVSSWTDEEQQGAALVRAVADLESSGCVVAVAGLDVEANLALPVLVAVERHQVARSCGADSSSYLVAGPIDGGAALVRACAPGALERLVDGGEVASLYGCRRLRSERVRDPKLGLVEPEKLVAFRRLRPSLES